MMNQPHAKIICELDGQEIELIIRELYKGVQEAKQANKKYYAQHLELIIRKLKKDKMIFQERWTSYFNNRK